MSDCHKPKGNDGVFAGEYRMLVAIAEGILPPMPTRQERLNNTIAIANVTGQPIRDKSLSGLGSKVVACNACDGTGLPQNTHIRNVEFCKSCNGRGYVSVAQPKQVRCDYGLSTKATPNQNVG